MISEKRMIAINVKAESTSSLLCSGTNNGAHLIPISEYLFTINDDNSLTTKPILPAFSLRMRVKIFESREMSVSKCFLILIDYLGLNRSFLSAGKVDKNFLRLSMLTNTNELISSRMPFRRQSVVVTELIGA